ncbi:MAG: TatD family hydrolase [Actinobacteria bacterium]|nr:TatD family hydrolase [Actinomycetota bacterium]MBS1883383.1 TatD family hydrolase [Actinomycetota bacterium]
MIDSHTHLFLCEKPIAELLEAAAAAGVDRMLNVGLDEMTNDEVVAVTETNEGVYAAVGRHPNDAAGFDDVAQAALADLGAHPNVRAIGETGLDFYRDTASPADQRRAFAGQIEVAIDLDLPIVIHARDVDGESAAIDEIFDTLDARAAGATVILHCFSAPQKVAEAAERGWYCSFAGNVTYPRSADLRFAAAKVPEDRILVETDAPFLTPQVRRKERNEPANVVATAEVVAAERGVSLAELERTIEANAQALFGW